MDSLGLIPSVGFKIGIISKINIKYLVSWPRLGTFGFVCNTYSVFNFVLLSVSFYRRESWRTDEWILMESDIEVFYWNLSTYSNFHGKPETLTDTLYESDFALQFLPYATSVNILLSSFLYYELNMKIYVYLFAHLDYNLLNIYLLLQELFPTSSLEKIRKMYCSISLEVRR